MTKAETRQRFAFASVFLLGANLLVGSSYHAEQDSWISAAAAGSILILWGIVLWRISRLAPGEDVVTLLKHFSKFPRIFLTIAVGIYCLSQGALILRAYAGFAQAVSLPRTDLFFLLLLSCGAVFALLRREDRILYRFSYLSALPILVTVLLLFFFLIPHFRSELLRPILYQNTPRVMVGAVENLSYPFGNAFLLLGVLSFPESNRKEGVTWLLSCCSAGILSLLIVLQNLMLLGGRLCSSLEFPNNFAASVVNVGDFFSRVEVVAALVFYLSAILRTAFFMKTAARAVGSLIPVPATELSLPLSALLLGYSSILFRNTDSLFHYLEIFPFVALPLQFGLPLILWILLEIRARKKTAGKTFRQFRRLF